MSVVILAALVTLATSLITSPPAAATTGVWSTPVTLSAPAAYNGGGFAGLPQIDSSADGSKVVSVFTRERVQSSYTYNPVDFSRSSDGGVTWSQGYPVSALDSRTSDPHIVSSADGTKLAVVWVDTSYYPYYRIKVIRSSNSGISWSGEMELSPWAMMSGSPTLTMSSDGTRITVAWQQWDSTITPISISVQSRSSTDSGATWSTSAALSVGSTAELNPQVASSSDGTKLTAVWLMKSGTSHMVQSRYSTNSGATWLPTISNVNNVIGADGPAASLRIVSSSSGAKVTAIWKVKVTGSSTYRVQTRSSSDYGASWGASIPFLSDTGQNADVPQIASSSDGSRLSAVWTLSAGSVIVIQSSSSNDSGATWSPAIDLSATGMNADRPQIVGSADGAKLTAVWSGYDVNGYYLVRSRASADYGASWSAVVDVSNFTAAQSYAPQLAGSSDGSVVAAVWSNTAGSSAYPTVRGSGISTLAPGLTPTFGNVARTADGFTVPIANYDAAYGWAVSTSAGVASVSGGVVTVTGLAAGVSATVTVTSTRSGYSSGSATSTGQALSAQSVTWSPTTAVTVPASPLTPSALATALGGASVSYSVTSAGTTGCTVNSSSGVVTYSAVGTCTVRASAAATSSYTAGTRDVSFTVTLATQTVTWSPTTAVTVPSSPLTPSASATALGGAPVSYAVTSAGTTGCTVNSVSGVLGYSAAGSCTVRASTVETSAYAAGSRDATFTISNASAGLVWSPSTALLATSGTEVFAAASATSPGAISYSVTSAGATGCAVDSATRTLTFTAAGSCQVTASVASASGYDPANSVSTFAITRDTPSLAWTPATTLHAGASAITMRSAITNSTGAVTYAVSSDSGAGCSIADSSLPVVTVTTAGTCTITAQTAQSDTYAAQTLSVPFTVALSTPMMTWSPTVALSMPAATVSPAQASSDSTGVIAYAVTSDSGTNCLVNAATGALSYAGAGQCQVTATTASTSRFASASMSVTFTVSLAVQSMSLSASATSLAPGNTATLTTSGYLGIGAITLSRSSGAGVCTVVGMTVLAVADGICVVTVSIAADGTYAAASSILTLTVTTPVPSSGGSGGSSSGAVSETLPASGVRQRSLDPIKENGGLSLGEEIVTIDGHIVPVRVEANSAGTGLDVIGVGWRIAISANSADGTQRALEPGGILAVTVGSTIDVSGSGFDAVSQVRTYLMSRSAHLGSLMTDKSGDFTGSVVMPADATLGPDTLQINGFTSDRTVRSVSLGVRVTAANLTKPTSVGSRIYFPYKSAVLTAKAKRSLMSMISQMPAGQSAIARVTGALRSTGATPLDRSLAVRRAAVVSGFLKAHGVSGSVTSSVRRVAVHDRYRDRRVDISFRLTN